MSETFSAPYSNIVPARTYREYSNDENVQAFFGSLNTIQQGILTWFAETPLAVYTSPNIYGPLLDWTLTGIYGIARPILTTTVTRIAGPLATNVMGEHPMATLTTSQSGSSYAVTDDFYKRVATWTLYRGDGLHFTLPWLFRRVERFLGGVNGADVPIDLATRPTISVSGTAFTITTPSTAASEQLQQLMLQGFLPVPLPYTFTVTLT